jgi:GTPase Era involved in 16S rRNA processing
MAIKHKENTAKGTQQNVAQCLKEKCAWYVSHELPHSEGCAIEKISDSLKYITLNLPS